MPAPKARRKEKFAVCARSTCLWRPPNPCPVQESLKLKARAFNRCGPSLLRSARPWYIRLMDDIQRHIHDQIASAYHAAMAGGLALAAWDFHAAGDNARWVKISGTALIMVSRVPATIASCPPPIVGRVRHLCGLVLLESGSVVSEIRAETKAVCTWLSGLSSDLVPNPERILAEDAVRGLSATATLEIRAKLLDMESVG